MEYALAVTVFKVENSYLFGGIKIRSDSKIIQIQLSWTTDGIFLSYHKD
jgi:hypothetical protein